MTEEDSDYVKPTLSLRFVRLPIVVDAKDPRICSWSHDFSENTDGCGASGCPAFHPNSASEFGEGPSCGAFGATLVPVDEREAERDLLTASFFRCQACLDAELRDR
jgi:hypothetical protein